MRLLKLTCSLAKPALYGVAAILGFAACSSNPGQTPSGAAGGSPIYGAGGGTVPIGGATSAGGSTTLPAGGATSAGGSTTLPAGGATSAGGSTTLPAGGA